MENNLLIILFIGSDNRIPIIKNYSLIPYSDRNSIEYEFIVTNGELLTKIAQRCNLHLNPVDYGFILIRSSYFMVITTIYG